MTIECVPDQHLLKLQSRKRRMGINIIFGISNIRNSPQFYEVGGTCCWKVYSRANYRGEGNILRAGSDRQKNSFAIKSVLFVKCK